MEQKNKTTWRYFKYEDFMCPCGCEFNNTSVEFINSLDRARAIAGVPFKINSGTRCKKHNKEVGGKDTSGHIKGIAVDIAITGSINRFKVVDALRAVGFTRIGIGESFCHVDQDMSKTQNVMWVY